MSDLSIARAAMADAEWLIRKACTEKTPAARTEALMQAHRLAPPDVQAGLLMGLIARVAMQPTSGPERTA